MKIGSWQQAALALSTLLEKNPSIRSEETV